MGNLQHDLKVHNGWPWSSSSWGTTHEMPGVGDHSQLSKATDLHTWCCHWSLPCHCSNPWAPAQKLKGALHKKEDNQKQKKKLESHQVLVMGVWLQRTNLSRRLRRRHNRRRRRNKRVGRRRERRSICWGACRRRHGRCAASMQSKRLSMKDNVRNWGEQGQRCATYLQNQRGASKRKCLTRSGRNGQGILRFDNCRLQQHLLAGDIKD